VRRLLLAAALVLAPALVYLLAAGVLGMVGVNRDFRPTPLAEGGVQIYLRSNGFHADLVLPTRAREADWSHAIPASHMRALAAPAQWIAFGWGDRAFMLETPTWRDIRLTTSLAALSGLGEGAMHVEYVARPTAYDVRPLQISSAQFRQLVAEIDRSFRRTPEGAFIFIAPGYGDADAFYEAIPVYTFWFTCNEWVRRVLSRSGLPAPAWSPFERTLFWHVPRPH
jgi:uncharacterized protein (TIGR02117 family)